MAMRPAVIYTPYATSSKEQTGDIITLAHFEEGNLWSETRDDAESAEKFDVDSIMPPLISEEEMDAMDSGDESDHDPMSTDILKEILVISQSRPSINRRDAHNKICDHIK